MPQTRTLALTRPAPAPRLALSLLALAGALWAHEARSQEATAPAATEAVAVAPGQCGSVVSHGYKFFGELK